MSRIIQQVNGDQLKAGTTFTVPLNQPATAGSKLVVCAFGGATITAKINNTSGAAFTSRTQALGTQATSIHDFDCSGGETAVFLTLGGADNISYVIYELAAGLTFAAASNNGAGATPVVATDFRAAAPSAALSPASGRGLIVGAFEINAPVATAPFSALRKWIGFGPLGKVYRSAANQPGANSQYIYASGIADVDASKSWPPNLAAGSFQVASTYSPTPLSTAWAVQALYVDTSGVLANPVVTNQVAAENTLPGTDRTNWFLSSNNANVAGYCDRGSYAPGDTVNFKVDSANNPFRVEVYRLGYYGLETFGARNVLGPGIFLTGTPAVQAAPSVDGTLGSVSCAWSTTASWTIPTDACPGVYHVLFRRTDNTAFVSSGVFVVRSASARNKIAVCTADFTWQAYNVWGALGDNGALGVGTWSGRSIYQIGGDGATANNAHRAYAVSFDRPYGTQSTNNATFLFDAEQPNILFLEAQGYDLAYCSNFELDATPTILRDARMVIVLGHQEYWTKNVYDALIAAADAGVNTVFVTGNTAGWRVRYAAGDTNRRTMICYKDGLSIDVTAGFDGGTGLDPGGYTGTWRDTRKVGGGVNNPDTRRENTLSGQMFMCSSPLTGTIQLQVTFAQKGAVAFRNGAAIQALTTGQTWSAATNNIGTELDQADGSSSQPANFASLNPTAMGTQSAVANANGTKYITSAATTASVTVYRRSSRALVVHFGSWRAWYGLTRWRSSGFAQANAIDLTWQNVVLAILYDLGAIPTTLTAMQPVNDTNPTDPATGSAVDRTAVTRAYGLRTPEDGRLLMAA